MNLSYFLASRPTVSDWKWTDFLKVHRNFWIPILWIFGWVIYSPPPHCERTLLDGDTNKILSWKIFYLAPQSTGGGLNYSPTVKYNTMLSFQPHHIRKCKTLQCSIIGVLIEFFMVISWNKFRQSSLKHNFFVHNHFLGHSKKAEFVYLKANTEICGSTVSMIGKS